VLIAQIVRLDVPALLDAHFPPHRNRQGLSIGWLSTIWLAHILSQVDHHLNRVQPWAYQRQETLQACIRIHCGCST
jgi:hypothetical protein